MAFHDKCSGDANCSGNLFCYENVPWSTLEHPFCDCEVGDISDN